jgi:uncharacterized membrane protein
MDASRHCDYRLSQLGQEPPVRMPLRLNLAKTASFAVLHFSVAFTIAYLLTGSIGVASALALIEPLANTVAYFFHERAWSRVRWEASGTPSTRLASEVK